MFPHNNDPTCSRSLPVPGLDTSLPPVTMAPLSALDSSCHSIAGAFRSDPTEDAQCDARFSPCERPRPTSDIRCGPTRKLPRAAAPMGPAFTGTLNPNVPVYAPLVPYQAHANDATLSNLAGASAPSQTAPKPPSTQPLMPPVSNASPSTATLPADSPHRRRKPAKRPSTTQKRPATRWTTDELNRLLHGLCMAGVDFAKVARIVASRGEAAVRKQVSALATHIGGCRAANAEEFGIGQLRSDGRKARGRDCSGTIPAHVAARQLLLFHGIPLSQAAQTSSTVEKSSRRSAEAKRKLRIQVVAAMPQHADKVRVDGHNPCVEILLGAHKTAWDIIAHLYGKWSLPLALQDPLAAPVALTASVSELVRKFGKDTGVVRLSYTLFDVEMHDKMAYQLSQDRQTKQPDEQRSPCLAKPPAAPSELCNEASIDLGRKRVCAQDPNELLSAVSSDASPKRRCLSRLGDFGARNTEAFTELGSNRLFQMSTAENSRVLETRNRDIHATFSPHRGAELQGAIETSLDVASLGELLWSRGWNPSKSHSTGSRSEPQVLARSQSSNVHTPAGMGLTKPAMTSSSDTATNESHPACPADSTDTPFEKSNSERAPEVQEPSLPVFSQNASDCPSKNNLEAPFEDLYQFDDDDTFFRSSLSREIGPSNVCDNRTPDTALVNVSLPALGDSLFADESMKQTHVETPMMACSPGRHDTSSVSNSASTELAVPVDDNALDGFSFEP